MSSIILIPLCAAAWIFTLIRLRTIFLAGIQKVDAIALNIFAMLLSFSMILTFLIVEFAAFFDAHTSPNLSLFISHISTIITIYFGTATSLSEVGVPFSKRVLYLVRILLVIVFITLLSIYIFFVSKLPSSLFFEPHNFAEVVFRLTTCFFGITMGSIAAITHLAYLPSRKSALMRFRGIIIVLCGFGTAIYLLVRAMIFASYFWPFLMSPVLITLSYVFLICLTVLCLFAVSSNKIYARFLIAVMGIKTWHTFQELKYLAEQLLVLCPTIGLPLCNPGFLRFLFNPEYYVYRTIISILDSKAMLVDFLAESLEPGNDHPMWEDDLLNEAIRINELLQSANPSNDFADIVETYRRVSRDLFASRKELVRP